MAEVEAVIAGLGIICTLLLYSAFMLRNSEESLTQSISVLLAFMGLVFMDLLMFAIFRISQETASINYLTDGILLTGLKAMIVVTSLLAFTLLMVIIFQLIFALRDYFKETISRRMV